MGFPLLRKKSGDPVSPRLTAPGLAILDHFAAETESRVMAATARTTCSPANCSLDIILFKRCTLIYLPLIPIHSTMASNIRAS
jgi:hypothetical protein